MTGNLTASRRRVQRFARGSVMASVGATLGLLGLTAPGFAGSDETAAVAAPAALTPREAGARYGQALGAVEICFGSKVTPAASALSQSYSGADQDTFKAQAAKIFDAWAKVKACVDQADPNKCKIIMDKSCLAAEAEIGANGSAVPGLVEFAKH